MVFNIFSLFKARSSSPENIDAPEATFEQAQELELAGQLVAAKAVCEAHLLRQPQHVASLLLLADLATRLHDLTLACSVYSRLIALMPTDVIAYYKRGNLLKDGNDLPAALIDYERAIDIDPTHANAFCNRGVVLERLGRYDLALESLTRAIELNPLDALAHYNRAAVLRELKQNDLSLASYDQAVEINPAYFEAYCNRGALLTELKRWDAALQSFDRSIAIESHFAPSYFNRAALYYKRQRQEEAMADYNRAITLSPDYAAAYAGRGMLWADLAYDDAALADYHKAIALDPTVAVTHFLQAEVLFQTRQFEAAIASYDRALTLDPECPYALGMRLHARMNICDWSGLESDLIRLTAGIESGKRVTPPFPMSALIDSPALQRAAAEIYVREQYPEDASLGEIGRRARGGKIKVGYFSADFREHPVALLTAELFELHDRARFEIIAFAFGPESNDATRSRLERGFDRFIDVRHRSNAAIAALSREMEIDIAVDLGGFTSYARIGIFAFRAAPVQLSYIGYLGTIGAPYMDYLIADATIIPLDSQQSYTEKIIYLPSYQANDSQRRMSTRSFTREELGLPATGFVFCCLNAAYKLTPSTFALWMRILRRVPHSSLFLYVSNGAAKERLSQQAEDSGVEASRIVFAAHIPVADYLARFCAMNLFLDTLPYNAGTTASDALWSGLPVLTCAGEGFPARVAASLLTSLDLPELITTTAVQYEDLAVDLATDEVRFRNIKDKLRWNRLGASLFNTRRFVAHLESAFEQIHSRAQAGMPLEHIYVKAVP